MQIPPGSASASRRAAIAQNVVVLDDDVADVDANAERDAPALRDGRFALGDSLLNRDRAFDGIDRARELDQRSVAHQLDHAAAVLGDQRLDELRAQRLQARDRAGFVLADQPAVADRVRGQNRRELAFRARSHGTPPVFAAAILTAARCYPRLTWRSTECLPRRSVLGALLRAAREVKERGTFTFADSAASFADLDPFMQGRRT
jgi:hypothetical protein